MSSPIFRLKVIAKQHTTIRLQICAVAEGGFDVTNQRDVLKVIGYGGDFMFPDGREDFCWEDRSVIARTLDFESQLWNDAWIEANASRYVTDARVVEVNHPVTSTGVDRAVFTYADADLLFARRLPYRTKS